MLEYRHESAVLLDATFGTNQLKEQLLTYLEFPSLLVCSHSIFLSHLRTIGGSLAISFGKSLFRYMASILSYVVLHSCVVVPFVYAHGIQQIVEWNTHCIYYNQTK